MVSFVKAILIDLLSKKVSLYFFRRIFKKSFYIPVIEEFILNTFERVVNLKEVDAKALPLFIQFLRNHQPEGVEISAGLPDPELEKFRYIPDMEMTVLQRKLEDLDSGKIDSLTWKKDL